MLIQECRASTVARVVASLSATQVTSLLTTTSLQGRGICGWFFWIYLAQFSQMVQIYSQVQRPDLLEQFNLNDMVMAPLLQNMVVIFLILLPLVTMRLFAEERSRGTDELLLTSPVSTLEITLGKFLGVPTPVCARALRTRAPRRCVAGG